MIETPVPKDSPLMRAWEAYRATEAYANDAYWALQSQHTEGSLWAAFNQGFAAALRAKDERIRDLEAALQQIEADMMAHGVLAEWVPTIERILAGTRA